MDKTVSKRCSDLSDDQVSGKDQDPYHTHKNQFESSHCLKLFSRKNVLLRHSPAHTDEQPYACEQCDE